MTSPPPAQPVLVLASSSPARLETLRRAGLNPRVDPSHVDETLPGDPGPAAAVALLARRKARAVATRRSPVGSRPPANELVLGCDSMLELDGLLMGKPGSADVATRRWLAMRGRTATLHTGHHVIDSRDGREVDAVASVEVTFADITEAEIRDYVATAEPLGVAGGFTVDGMGGAFVSGIRGDYHAVVGVSLPLLRELLAALGVRWTSLWGSTS